jgi:DNA repair protein RAD5
LEPWGQYPFITQPFLAQDPKALDVVQFILEQCLLRREKNMKDKDGKPIVDLPDKTVRGFSCGAVCRRRALII